MKPLCIAKLLEAVDAEEYPPVSAQDYASWVQRWRAREKEMYSDSEEGERLARVAITRSLIATLFAGREYRIADRKRQEKRLVRRCLGRRLPVGVATVQRGKVSVVSIGEATMEEWDLYRFSSVDAASYKGGRYVRFLFHEDDKGYFKLSFRWRSKPYYVRCGSILMEWDVPAGHYRILPVDKEWREFVLEFGGGPLTIRAVVQGE